MNEPFTALEPKTPGDYRQLLQEEYNCRKQGQPNLVSKNKIQLSFTYNRRVDSEDSGVLKQFGLCR